MTKLIEDTISQLLANISQEPGRLLYCRCCQTAITCHQNQMNDGHISAHRFTNPQGICYSIRCFRQAPGCSISGTATLEYSWFANYYWQIASCSECHEHLGWYYQNTKPRAFFGLITGRLTDTLR